MLTTAAEVSIYAGLHVVLPQACTFDGNCCELQDVATVSKGLRSGMRTGLRVGWQKTGKPVVSQLARLPFGDEAADLISSLWQRGASFCGSPGERESVVAGWQVAHTDSSAVVLGLACC